MEYTDYDREVKNWRITSVRKHHPVLYDIILGYNNEPDLPFKQRVYNFRNNIKDIPKCVCGNNLNFHNGSYTKSCSVKCASIREDKIESQIKTMKSTLMDRYGVDNVFEVDHIKEKIKESFLDNWGVEHISESKEILNKSIQGVRNRSTEDIKKSNTKREETNLLRYGVANVAELNESKEKSKDTCLKKYGVPYYSKTPEYIRKTRNSMIKKYGVTHLSKCKSHINEITEKRKRTMDDKWSNSIINKYDINIISFNYVDRTIDSLCDNCGDIFTINHHLLYQRTKNNLPICTICNDPLSNRTSYLQKEIAAFVDSLGIKFSENYIYSDISKKEVDIYIPSKKFAIEFNGLYWHSELHREKNYHINKTKECDTNGICLFHIWEDDWLYKQDIIKSMLRNRLGQTSNKIYGRKTKVKELDYSTTKKFLDNNHLQGNSVSKYRFGLYHNNELVSVMTFGGLRRNLGQTGKESHFELMRFCNKLDTIVVGGASKLMRYFIKIYEPVNITTYSNIDLGYSSFYEKLGFILDKQTKPGYHYIIDGMRKNRYQYRKDILVKDGFDPNKTEHQIMIERGYFRIYNTGNYRWVLIR